MKNTVRFLLPSIVVFGVALVHCSGTDQTPVEPSATGGSGGSGGLITGGTSGDATGGSGGSATGGSSGSATGGSGGSATGGSGGSATGGSSGSATGGSGGGTDAAPPIDSGTGDAPADTVAPDAAGACPSPRPTNNSPCVDTGQICSYTGGPGPRTCDCVTVENQSQWICVTTPADAGPATCPSARPNSDAPCPNPALSCKYPAGNGAPPRTCNCVTVVGQDVWACVTTPADAGPPLCPTAGNRPASGDACTDTSLLCTYAAAGSGNPAQTCQCIGFLGTDQWVCAPTPADAGPG
jgi:hypothetical protein